MASSTRAGGMPRSVRWRAPPPAPAGTACCSLGWPNAESGSAMAPAEAPAPRMVRCAIYTRKSTEEGLGQEFNSLAAQRECAQAYILSQRPQGWTVLPEPYDDGGFSGANLARPALQRLLADIQAGKVDCVVIYKVDRLSRSLFDFARIMQILEKHGVSFVS